MEKENNNMISEQQRKRALESPSQMHDYVKVTSVSAFTVALTSILLIAATMVWAYLGEVSDKVSYKGIIFENTGLRDVSISHGGTIRQMKVSKGQKVTVGQPIALVSIDNSYSNVSSTASGRVVHMKIDGEDFQPMEPIVSLVGDGKMTLVAYTDNMGFRDLVVGMKVQIWPANEDRDEIGYFTGTIVATDPYPVEVPDVEQRFRNPELVKGVLPENGAAYEVSIAIDRDENNELCWSFGKPENVDVSVGTLCNVVTETKRRSIIEYIFEKVRTGVNSIRD